MYLLIKGKNIFIMLESCEKVTLLRYISVHAEHLYHLLKQLPQIHTHTYTQIHTHTQLPDAAVEF